MNTRTQKISCFVLCVCFGCSPPSTETPNQIEVLNKSDNPVANDSADQIDAMQSYREFNSTWIEPFKSDWDRDFKIAPGMTVEELNSYITENNQNVREADPSDWENRDSRIPAFAYPELRLYVFIDMNSPEQTGPEPVQSLKYLVNGRWQFWIDLAIEDGKIKNIYITPGNMTWTMPQFLLAGEASLERPTFDWDAMNDDDGKE